MVEEEERKTEACVQPLSLFLYFTYRIIGDCLFSIFSYYFCLCILRKALE